MCSASEEVPPSLSSKVVYVDGLCRDIEMRVRSTANDDDCGVAPAKCLPQAKTGGPIACETPVQTPGSEIEDNMSY